MNPTRKKVRFENFDYSENGAYFITICTQNREKIFWNDCYKDKINSDCKAVGADVIRPKNAEYEKLSEYGQVVYEAINNISEHYEYAVVEKFVLMPNHIHMIILINKHHMEDGRILSAKK